MSDSTRAIIPLETILVGHRAVLCKQLTNVSPLFQLHINALLLFLILILRILSIFHKRCGLLTDLPHFIGVLNLVLLNEIQLFWLIGLLFQRVMINFYLYESQIIIFMHVNLFTPLLLIRDVKL